jgi:hypothetical protein
MSSWLKRGTMAVVAVGCVVALVRLQASGRAASAPQAPPHTGATGSDEMERKLAHLERELGNTRARLSTVEAHAATAALASAVPPEMTPEERAAREQRLPPALAAVPPEERERVALDWTQETMKEAMSGGRVDRDRERQVQTELAAQLEKPAYAETKIRSLSCTGPLCEVVFQHADEQARGKFFSQEVTLSPPFNCDLFARYDEATRTTSVYLARQGEPLPKVERLLRQ